MKNKLIKLGAALGIILGALGIGTNALAHHPEITVQTRCDDNGWTAIFTVYSVGAPAGATWSLGDMPKVFTQHLGFGALATGITTGTVTWSLNGQVIASHPGVSASAEIPQGCVATTVPPTLAPTTVPPTSAPVTSINRPTTLPPGDGPILIGAGVQCDNGEPVIWVQFGTERAFNGQVATLNGVSVTYAATMFATIPYTGSTVTLSVGGRTASAEVGAPPTGCGEVTTSAPPPPVFTTRPPSGTPPPVVTTAPDTTLVSSFDPTAELPATR
jgi:hypothetical protein